MTQSQDFKMRNFKTFKIPDDTTTFKLNLSLVSYNVLTSVLTYGLDLTLAECKHEADVVIAMDGSGSIEKPNFYKMLDFVKEMIEAMDVDTGTRISLMTFSTDASLRFVYVYFRLSICLSV